jgi:dTDP-4-dehydrorhamnose 3,5-epimerase
LEDDTELLYKRDRLYAPECERGLIYDDPNLAIDWESIKEEYGIVQFIVSAKDQKNMTLKEFESENPF